MNIVTLSNLQLDTSSRTLRNNTGHSIELRPLTFDVFNLLIENHGTPVKREKIYEVCWHGRVVTDQALTNVISELRRALISLKAKNIEIKTVSKMGYYLTLPCVNSPANIGTPPSSINNGVVKAPIAANDKSHWVERIGTCGVTTRAKAALFVVFANLMLLTACDLFRSPSMPNFMDTSNYTKLEISQLTLYFNNVSGEVFDITKVVEGLDSRHFRQCATNVYLRVYRSLYDESRLAAKMFVFTQSPIDNQSYRQFSTTEDTLAEVLNKIAIQRKSECN
ncbi:winged helix-turn-helix domain-containing protein [Vibrio bivalvicida]|uniref:Transcriptional regulator n=1 Tax=Vibrio bivalvicida TaxID=1276888 RepID=A0ABV4MMH2_9VIBR